MFPSTGVPIALVTLPFPTKRSVRQPAPKHLVGNLGGLFITYIVLAAFFTRHPRKLTRTAIRLVGSTVQLLPSAGQNDARDRLPRQDPPMFASMWEPNSFALLTRPLPTKSPSSKGFSKLENPLTTHSRRYKQQPMEEASDQ